MARTKKIAPKTKTAPIKEKKATPKKITVSTKKVVSTAKVTKAKDNILKKVNSSPLAGMIIKIVAIVVAIFLVVILADYAVQYVRNEQSVAVINGKRISKAEWHKTLETASGKAIAQSLIDDSIVLMEARKAEVEVTKEEIDERVEEIKEEIGGEEAFQAALIASNIELDYLRDQIRLDSYYIKLIGPSLEYTEDDVKAFFEQYGEVYFAQDAALLQEGEKLDYETYKEQITEYYIAQLVAQEKDTWIVEKEADYTIQNNATEKPKYKFFGTINQIINNLGK